MNQNGYSSHTIRSFEITSLTDYYSSANGKYNVTFYFLRMIDKHIVTKQINGGYGGIQTKRDGCLHIQS